MLREYHVVPWQLFGLSDDVWAQPGGLLFADTSISGQFAQQGVRRTMAQGAALGGIANSELRRLLSRNQPLGCTDAPAGDSFFLQFGGP